MLLISVKVSSPVTPPPTMLMTVDVSFDAVVGVSGRWWLASLWCDADVITDGTVDSSFNRSSEDVDVVDKSGEEISRCDVVNADTLALTVERSPVVKIVKIIFSSYCLKIGPTPASLNCLFYQQYNL